MSNPVCRIGDIGIGYCRICDTQTSGKINTGSTTVQAGGKGVARDGDIVMAACGHVGKITASSSKLAVNGKSVARVGDIFTGAFDGRLTAGMDTFLSA